ncbi:MAG: diguanylate cyclase [Betaproteobacteria bacterium]
MRLRASAEILILFAFVAGAALLGTTAWFAVTSGRAYLASDARGDRLHGAERTLTALLLTVTSAESGVRGYALTGRAEYLDLFRRAEVEIPIRLADLRPVVADVPGTERDFGVLETETRQKMHQMRQLAELRGSQGFDAAQRAVAAGDGRELALRVRARVEGLQQALAWEAAGEMARSVERHAGTVRGVMLTAALLVAILAAAGSVIAWELGERRRLLRRLEQDANHDPLTRLPNRRFFVDWLAYALAQARRDGAPLGPLYIDIDGFKDVNDRRGHKAGDAVLVEIACRFRAAARESDVVVRLGGDEFALAVPRARDGREVAALAQRLLSSLSDPELAPLADVPLGASIGVAFYPDDAGDVVGLIAAADDAMYVAKRGGRNRAVFSAVAAAA